MIIYVRWKPFIYCQGWWTWRLTTKKPEAKGVSSELENSVLETEIQQKNKGYRNNMHTLPETNSSHFKK